jgi:hypothetical protein
VSLCLKQDGLMIQYASLNLKRNDEICKLAVSQNGLAIQFLPEQQKRNLKVVIPAMQ